MARVILAYTGGLETSVSVHYLRNSLGLDVLTFTADLGQRQEFQVVGEGAIDTGAASAIFLDLQDLFVRHFVFPALRAGARHPDGYVLSAALSQCLIAREMVRVAAEEGCEYVAHGCVAKGNDQFRFENVFASLAPQLKVLAPMQAPQFRDPAAARLYAETHDIHVPTSKREDVKVDENLWGRCAEFIHVTDTWAAVAPDVYALTANAAEAPDAPTEIRVGFLRGEPVSLDGEALPGTELLRRLNKMAGAYGVGRLDVFEDRLTGFLAREFYEAPAATVLHLALDALAEITLGRETRTLRADLSRRFADLVYAGLWYHEAREALDAAFARLADVLSGEVRVRLDRGQARVVGRKSDASLFRPELQALGEGDLFPHAAARDLLDLTTLPRRIEAERRKRRARSG